MQTERRPGRGLSQAAPGPGWAGKRSQIDDFRSYRPPKRPQNTCHGLGDEATCTETDGPDRRAPGVSSRWEFAPCAFDVQRAGHETATLLITNGNAWNARNFGRKGSRSVFVGQVVFGRPGGTKKPHMFRKRMVCLALPPSAARPKNHSFLKNVWFLGPKHPKNHTEWP